MLSSSVLGLFNFVVAQIGWFFHIRVLLEYGVLGSTPIIMIIDVFFPYLGFAKRCMSVACK
jgi:hypothetical protein